MDPLDKGQVVKALKTSIPTDCLYCKAETQLAWDLSAIVKKMGRTFVILKLVFRQNLTVAMPFWVAWLGLAGVEATVGTSSIVGFLYFITIPLLVGFVTWSSLHLLLVLDLGNRVANIVMLGLAVLVSASVITAVGIVAAASFKELLST